MNPPLRCILVEHVAPDAGEASAVARRIDECLALRGARWTRSYVSVDGRRSLCEFEAPDAETVREAFRMAGHAFERAWVAERHERGA